MLSDWQTPHHDLGIEGLAHVELYVGNALHSAHFYRTALGFSPVARAGPETGLAGQRSYVLQQGRIRLILSAALQPAGDIAAHAALHGDGVRDIALRVRDVGRAYEVAVQRGATPVREPTRCGSGGQVTLATVATFGDTVHSFIATADGADALPFLHCTGFGQPPGQDFGLTDLDHMAVCLPKGELDHWAAFYRDVFGFVLGQAFTVESLPDGIRLQVVELPGRQLRFTLVEPLASSGRSQLTDYLDHYGAPGVQHLAFASRDILRSVRLMHANGLATIAQPGSYYDDLPARIGTLPVSLERMRACNILADRDALGYLLQVFSAPIQDRPTLFLEIIERHGTDGFGPRNIGALFAAVELDRQMACDMPGAGREA